MSNELEIEYKTIKKSKNLQKNKNSYILNASNDIQSQTTNSSQNNSSFIANTSDLLIPSESFLNSISKEGALFLRNTMHHLNEVVNTDDGTYVNEIISPNICIFCDRYIIGVAKLNWISKEQIIKHSNRISVDKWKEITGNTAMNPLFYGVGWILEGSSISNSKCYGNHRTQTTRFVDG